MYGWEFSGRVSCNQCNHSFEIKDCHVGKTGRLLCPCCHMFVRTSARSSKAKRFKEKVESSKGIVIVKRY